MNSENDLFWAIRSAFQNLRNVLKHVFQILLLTAVQKTCHCELEIVRPASGIAQLFDGQKGHCHFI